MFNEHGSSIRFAHWSLTEWYSESTTDLDHSRKLMLRVLREDISRSAELPWCLNRVKFIPWTQSNKWRLVRTMSVGHARSFGRHCERHVARVNKRPGRTSFRFCQRNVLFKKCSNRFSWESQLVFDSFKRLSDVTYWPTWLDLSVFT